MKQKTQLYPRQNLFTGTTISLMNDRVLPFLLKLSRTATFVW